MDKSQYGLSFSDIVSQEDKEGSASSVTVAVRVRPFSQRELADKTVRRVVSMCGNETTVTSDNGIIHRFAYDFSFWSFDSENGDFAGQELVHSRLAQPLLSRAFEGYNTCLFAYGQTGSGKSYSIMGQGIENDAGIIPRFCKDLFFSAQQARDINQVKIKLEVSSFEIYNEQIYDLLCSSKEKNGKTPKLNVRGDPVLGPYVEDLSTFVVKSFEDVEGWITLGNKNRAMAATKMNDKSSRSHMVFTIILTQTETEMWEGHEHDHSIKSKINLVDLAGSERQSQAMTSGERFREGVNINKSLLTLGKVISLLSEHSAQNGRKKKIYIPYRDSVLTWLLKESLGGNSKTAMIATISPASSHIEETLSTLRYAKQAQSVVNVARVNENPKDKLIQEMRAEIEHLKLQTENMNPEVAQTGTLPEIVCLHDKLKAREEEMTRSWQEQLKIEESRLLEITQLKHQIERYEQQTVEYNRLQKQIKALEKEHSDLRSECTLLTKKLCDTEKSEQDKKDEIVEQLNNKMTHEKDDLEKPQSLPDETRSKLKESEMTWKHGQSNFIILQTLRGETQEDTLKEFTEKEQTWKQKEQDFNETIRTQEDTLKEFTEKEQTWKQKEQDFNESIRIQEDTFKEFMEKEQTWKQKEQDFNETIRTQEDTLKEFTEKEQTWKQKEQDFNESIRIQEDTLKEFTEKEQTWKQKEQDFNETIRTQEDTLKEFMEKEQTWKQKEQDFNETIRTQEDTLKEFTEKEQTWKQKEQDFNESIRTQGDTLKEFMEKEQTWKQKEQDFNESIRTQEDTLKEFMEKEQTWKQKKQDFNESIRDHKDQNQMLTEHIENLYHEMEKNQVKEFENMRSSSLLEIAKWSQNSTFFQKIQPALQQSSKLTIAKWPQSLTFFQQNQPAIQQTSSTLSLVTSDVQANPQPKGHESIDFRSLHSDFQAEDISHSIGAKCIQAFYRKLCSQ